MGTMTGCFFWPVNSCREETQNTKPSFHLVTLQEHQELQELQERQELQELQEQQEHQEELHSCSGEP